MNRAQRILHYIAGRKTPATLHAIANAVADTESTARFSTLVAAQLNQLTKAGKLARHGQPLAYTYTATSRTLVDGRKVDVEGKPRTTKRDARSGTARKVAVPNAQRSNTASHTPIAPQPTRRLLHARVRTAPASDQTETVAQFLARGGRVQKLANGDCSQPLRCHPQQEPRPAHNDRPARARHTPA